MNDAVQSDRAEWKGAGLSFTLVLIFHAWGAAVGWNNLNLPGCEFRQTQTAISAHFILQEKNYSLAYPTPVLGKPWSIPMEFPLYQWTVAKVAEVSGWPLTQVGRGVSLACFYLALPALYLLIRRLGLARSRALLVLCFVVSCPLYIFYARSFLIETMAWMFGAWFLAGYVLGVEKRSAAWVAVAALGGIGAGLVKVTTLIALLFPALSWTGYWFWQDWRNSQGNARLPALARRAAWCALGVALPFVAAWGWVRYSDQVKALSPAGAFLQSGPMSDYNFGVGRRFDPGIWSQHWRVIFHEVVTVPVAVVAGLIALFFGRRRAGVIGLLLLHFFVVQLIFPILYAWHEYYYVAIAMLPMVALGLGVCGLLESRVPRPVAWVVTAGLLAAQGAGYFQRYHAEQSLRSEGGSELTVALRETTGPDDVLIIAGEDWSSMIPYYAQRRALMIRREFEQDWPHLEKTFSALKGENVAALLLSGAQRGNRQLLARAAARFDLETRGPAFSVGTMDVYLEPSRAKQARSRLGAASGRFANVTVPDLPPERTEDRAEAVTPEIAAGALAAVAPAPDRMRFPGGGAGRQGREGGEAAIIAQPDSDLWLRPPAAAARIAWVFGIFPAAYEKAGDRTDGVEFTVWGETPDGQERRIFRRMLDPVNEPGDRGDQHAEIVYTPRPGETLRFSSRPGGGSAFDWSYWVRIEVR